MPATRTEIKDIPLQIWERLLLITGESGKEGVYSCRVSDMVDNCLVISRPVFQQGKSLLANNRTIDVTYTRADAAYKFSARITEDDPKSDDHMLLVDFGKISRLQRRRFVRIDLDIKVSYQRLRKPITADVRENKAGVEKTSTINISAGGMLIPTVNDIHEGDLLLIRFRAGELKNVPEYILAICRQTRIDDDNGHVAGLEMILAEDISKYISTLEIAFLPNHINRFSSKMQNSLVSELFNEQVALRQKGLL